MLFGSGVELSYLSDPSIRYEFQRCRVRLQLAMRAEYRALAVGLGVSRVALISDRGEAECAAYLSPDDWNRLCAEEGWGRITLTGGYAAVIHLVSAAVGAPDAYTLANNSARSESLEAAVALDAATLAAWSAHPNLEVIGCEGGLDAKMDRLVAAVVAVLEREAVAAGAAEILSIGCSCTEVRVGSVVYGRNLDLDCSAHGTESRWWKSPEQRRARQLQSDHLRVLNALSRIRRHNPDALPMRILVRGSRTFADRERIDAIVELAADILHREVVIVTGGTDGADGLAAAAGWEAGLEVAEFVGGGELCVSEAGFPSNQQVLEDGGPHLVIAFDASGDETTDMVRRAESLGVLVCVLEADSMAAV
jgi:hypothetical protein